MRPLSLMKGRNAVSSLRPPHFAGAHGLAGMGTGACQARRLDIFNAGGRHLSIVGRGGQFGSMGL